eukprot:scaffold14000_cov135-Isochrysis_galbana.AAC.8
MTRAARTKLRSIADRVTSCRNSRENNGCGSSAHAIASVMAVSTQFSSPSGDRRSPSVPGSRLKTSAARMPYWSPERALRCIDI